MCRVPSPSPSPSLCFFVALLSISFPTSHAPRRTGTGAAPGEPLAEAWSAFIQLSSPTRRLLREALLNYNYELICRLEAAFFDRFMPGCQVRTTRASRAGTSSSSQLCENTCHSLMPCVSSGGRGVKKMATNPNLAGSGVEVFGYCSFLSASCLPAAARPKLGDEYLVVLLHNSRGTSYAGHHAPGFLSPGPCPLTPPSSPCDFLSLCASTCHTRARTQTGRSATVFPSTTLC